MYTVTNFPTKKALKEAVASGQHVEVYQPGPFGGSVSDGDHSVEGPHYPKPHTWYARVRVKDSIIIKVLS
jgi:hypothetical protein